MTSRAVLKIQGGFIFFFIWGKMISQGRLSEIEQGKTKPSAETLKELRKEINVDLNWLFDEDI
ncbi:transcriptional regulator with XRE-family HTH domain [Paenibacillus sp. PastH-3]|nr:transcriptional regulator with XRE-family HTH domain [Paenibacillus sp. PastH-4]MDH6447050.1 transcriptional regulator with XRE-family HTH domain [Paenibacillus sp. PastF-4]MDH6530847.1 transcriptional regulator with XRE-family HTH domain [Paenibacillus sp. PastH-3]